MVKVVIKFLQGVKKMKYIFLVVLTIVVMATTHGFAAESSVLVRIDSAPNQKPSSTFWVSTPYGEIGAFNCTGANFQPADWQIGGNKIVIDGNTKIRVGAYYSNWNWDLSPKDFVFIMPYVAVEQKIGSGKVFGDMNYYIPLNGGPHILTSSDMYAQFPLPFAKNVNVGMTGQYTKVVGTIATFNCGPRISCQVDKNWKINTSALISDKSSPKTYRFEILYTTK